VINSDGLGVLAIKLVVPLTEWQPSFEDKVWHVRINPNLENSLSKTSSADVLQVGSVSVQRLVRKLGYVDDETLERLTAFCNYRIMSLSI
jgi:mRNA interferase MazF